MLSASAVARGGELQHAIANVFFHHIVVSCSK